MQAQARYQKSTAAATHSNGEQHTAGHALYQCAIAAAILLFLLSFWSC